MIDLIDLGKQHAFEVDDDKASGSKNICTERFVGHSDLSENSWARSLRHSVI